MARRREGRELFEIFKETSAAREKPAGEAVPFRRREPAAEGLSGLAHTIRLGDRRQVEVFLSLGWVYGIIIFLFLALLGMFILGRTLAPAPQPVVTEEAPEDFAEEAARVEAAVPSQPAATAPSTAAEGTAGGPAAAEAAGAAGAVETSEPPVPVTSQGMYTLVVITYRNKAALKDRAGNVVDFLKARGETDAQVVVGKSGKWIFVIVGSFETTRSEDAQRLRERIRALSYEGDKFNTAYYIGVNRL